MNRPKRLVIVDVDGLRRDIFRAALAAADLPNVERIVGGREGYYFGAPTTGVHGGLYPEESEVVLTFACAGGSPDDIAWLRETVAGAVPAALAQLGLSGERTGVEPFGKLFLKLISRH